jgi:hypothetical protein
MKITGFRVSLFTVLLACCGAVHCQVAPSSGARLLPASVKTLVYPDAPSVARNATETARSDSATEKQSYGIQPLPAGRLDTGTHDADAKYVAVMGSMFASSIMTVELTHECLVEYRCSYVPDPLRSRAAMYATGLSAEVGVAYLSYYLKRKEHKWWFIPAALVTTANIYVAHHAAVRMR